jgi:hypothetical protein
LERRVSVNLEIICAVKRFSASLLGLRLHINRKIRFEQIQNGWTAFTFYAATLFDTGEPIP